MERRHFIVLLLSGWSFPVCAGEVTSGLVAQVIDGDTFALRDGSEVRLAGLLAPKPEQLAVHADKAAQTLPQRASDELGRLLLGRTVQLGFAARHSDRNGRLLAQVTRDDGLWVQGMMLRHGLARVATTPDTRLRADEMLAEEATARAARRGLWAARAFRVLDATETPKFTNSFQIVEGIARDVRQGREQDYVHFDGARLAALTLIVAASERRVFGAAGRRLDRLGGQRLRVRGWLKWFDGPVIEATHPEQIEVLA